MKLLCSLYAEDITEKKTLCTGAVLFVPWPSTRPTAESEICAQTHPAVVLRAGIN